MLEHFQRMQNNRICYGGSNNTHTNKRKKTDHSVKLFAKLNAMALNVTELKKRGIENCCE